MSKELMIEYGVTGLTTLYFDVRRLTDGQRWYTTTPVFEAYNAAHVTAYGITMTEEGTSGNYYGDFPTGISAAGIYQCTLRIKAGGSIAWPADTPISSVLVNWTGSAVSSIAAGVTLAASQHVVVDSGTVTTLTNLPAVPTDWLTAAGVKADAVTKIQTGLATPTNITAGTITTVGTLTTYTGNTPQTGDAFARLGAPSGASISADIQTRSTYAGGDTSGTTTLLSRVTGSVALASQIPAHFTNSTFSADGVFATAALANAPTGGGGSDPWSTALPGSYGSGTAGAILSAVNTQASKMQFDTPSGGSLYGNFLKVDLYGLNGVVYNTSSTVAAKLTSDGLDNIVVETGVNARQALSPILASAAGLLAGAGTGTITIKGGNVSTTRIVATTDNSNNRTAVTLTLPA